MTATHEGPRVHTGLTELGIQERRRRIATALEAAGIAQQTNERSTELTTNASVVLERRYLSKDREGNILVPPEPEEEYNGISTCHSDKSYMPYPSMATFLHRVEVTREAGGARPYSRA